MPARLRALWQRSFALTPADRKSRRLLWPPQLALQPHPFAGPRRLCACAGPARDILARGAGPSSHIPQALFWLIISLFTHQAVFGNVALSLFFRSAATLFFPDDGLGSGKMAAIFAHALIISAFWVRCSETLRKGGSQVTLTACLPSVQACVG